MARGRFLQVIGIAAEVLLWGCGAPIKVARVTPEDLTLLDKAGNFPDRVYRVEPADKLQIKFTFHPEMTQEVTVRPDGKIGLIGFGEVAAAGLTLPALEQLLVERTSDRLRNPEVIVTIVTFSEKFVYVGGEVLKPGTIVYRRGLTPLQALLAAGGPNATARIDSVILVRTGGLPDNYVSRTLDLEAAIRDGVREPIYLAPHDVLFVPRTPIAEANVWVKQHITDFIPFVHLGSIPVAPAP